MASHLSHDWAQMFDFLLSLQLSDDLDCALLGNASTFLHQQLTTHFKASEWPLWPLRDILDYVIGQATGSTLEATLIPTTLLLNTAGRQALSSFCQGPRPFEGSITVAHLGAAAHCT